MAEHQVETIRERLARLMDERRQELGLDWNDVVKLAGLTKTGLNTIRFETRAIRAKSARGIEFALQWPTGAIDVILRGGELPGRHILLTESQEQADLLIRLAGGETRELQVKHIGGDPSVVVSAIKDALETAGFDVNVSQRGGSYREGSFRHDTRIRPLDADVDVVAREVLADEELPERVKKALLDGYRRVREEVAEELRKSS